MIRTVRTLLTIVCLGAVLVGCSGDSEEATTTASPTTTTTTIPATTTSTAVLSGAAAVTVCSEALNDAWANAQAAEDPVAAVEVEFGNVSLITKCEFLFMADGPPPELGLTADEVFAQLEREVEPELFGILTEPGVTEFSETADEL